MVTTVVPVFIITGVNILLLFRPSSKLKNTW